MLINGHTKNGLTPVIDLPGLAQRPRPSETPMAESPMARSKEALRHAIENARSSYEALETRTLELQNQIRREEHTVAQHRRKIQDLEDQLMRWQPILAEAEARLDAVRQEFEKLVKQVRDSRESQPASDQPRRSSDRAA